MDNQNDLAAPILSQAPELTDDERADLWDAFHGSKSAEELQQKLTPLAIPDDTRRRLLEAKHTPPLDKTTALIQKMAQIPQQQLDLAEAHPNVLKFMATAAKEPESKPATETAAAPEKRTPLAQTPRPDGQPHLPSIPDNHYRVQSSDGALHDIPAENIDKAREIDPLLHVLNP